MTACLPDRPQRRLEHGCCAGIVLVIGGPALAVLGTAGGVIAVRHQIVAQPTVRDCLTGRPGPTPHSRLCVSVRRPAAGGTVMGAYSLTTGPGCGGRVVVARTVVHGFATGWYTRSVPQGRLGPDPVSAIEPGAGGGVRLRGYG